MKRTSYIPLQMILMVFVLSTVKSLQAEFTTKIITGKLSGKKITFDIYLIFKETYLI